MEKVIFEVDSVILKSYLKTRFQINKPTTYVIGQCMNLKVDINNLGFVINKDMTCEYTLGLEGQQTVEYLRFDKFTIGLYSDAKPQDILNSEEMKHILRIGVFSPIDYIEKNIMLAALKESGFKIIKENLKKRDYPYKISKSKDYFVLKYPVMYSEKELSEDIEIIENILYKLKDNENILVENR